MNQDVLKWKLEGNYFNYNKNNIFYLQKGDGLNLLILHGYPFNSFEWKEAITELSISYKVTVFDFLGMGFSDKPKNHKYSFEEYCEIVNALLKELKIYETHILSHDLGVSIAQELIAREDENKNTFKIQSSAFVNGSLFIDAYKPRFIQKILSNSPTIIGKTISKLLTKKMVNNSVKSVFGPFTKPSEDFLELQWEIINYNDGKEITYRIRRLVFEKYKFLNRWVKSMQETSIPMCYICGPFDPNSGEHMAKRYNELIPKPKIYIQNRFIGHWPHIEDVKSFLDSFYNFQSNYVNHLKK